MGSLARLFLSLILLGAVFFGWYAVERASPRPLASSAPIVATSSAPSSSAYVNASEDLIFATAPKPGATLTSTILLKGFARGSWYFEAVFPIVVINKDGMTIGQGQGRADGDWMTNAFVPFSTEIDLKAPYSGPAIIKLEKDNPSGDPSRDASLSIPVTLQ